MRSDNTGPSPYARLEQKTGWHDEYTGAPHHYYIGHCDSCSLKGVSFSEGWDNQTEGKKFAHLGADRWVTWHNQTHHQAQTRPRVKAATPAVNVQLVCGHSYGAKTKEVDASTRLMNSALSALGNADGVCGRDLRRYTGGWDHDRPLYVCDFGHYNEVPEAVDRKALNTQVRSVNAHLVDMHEGFGIDEQIAELEAKRKRMRR